MELDVMEQGGIGNSTEYRLYYSVTWNIQGGMRNRTRCGTEQGGTSHGMEGNGCCGASLGQWRVTWKRPLKFFNESALAAHKCCISMTAF